MRPPLRRYDSLNRLTAATNTGSGEWSQTFSHDGFGNLRVQFPASGTVPNIQLDVNLANNRMTSAGWSYDLNGNAITIPVLGGGTANLGYDIDNRLTSWFKAGVGYEYYGHLPDNKRVWKKAPSGAETIYFYGAGGQKLITYSVNSGTFGLTKVSENVYFGGKLIRGDGAAVVQDRLGSVIWRAGVGPKDFFPYGDEIGTPAAGNVDKFGTYLRDQTTGLDYADQRYFTGLQGRFLTADPAGSGINWYAYVGGDPVNSHDPSGLNSENELFACFNQNWFYNLGWCTGGGGGGTATGGGGGTGTPDRNFSGGSTPSVTSQLLTGTVCDPGTLECVLLAPSGTNMDAPPDLSWIGSTCPVGQVRNALGTCDLPLGPAATQVLGQVGQTTGALTTATPYVAFGGAAAAAGVLAPITVVAIGEGVSYVGTQLAAATASFGWMQIGVHIDPLHFSYGINGVFQEAVQVSERLMVLDKAVTLGRGMQCHKFNFESLCTFQITF